jgi:hypothetical protein
LTPRERTPTIRLFPTHKAARWIEGPGAGLGHLWKTVDWSRLGSNLPYTTAMDVHLGPDNRVYVATHGGGIWSIAKP